MGWGFRMFEGDPDIEAAIHIQEEIDVQLVGTYGGGIHRTLTTDPATLEGARIKLNTTSGTKLMNGARNFGLGFTEPGYSALVLAAVMMHVGAELSPEDRQYLGSIYPGIPKISGFPMATSDGVFRTPGAVQFLRALENYVHGQPRSFCETSCYNCGKIERELDGGTLKRCQRCVKNNGGYGFDHRFAYYCDKDCQTEDWKEHKLICPRVRGAIIFA